MNKTILHKINRLRQMPVSELRQEWLRLYGEPTRSRNRDYLWKRLAWRVQELQYGGLSDKAKAGITELAPHASYRARTPISIAPPDNDAQDAPRRPRNAVVRDLRIPMPGTVLTRPYKGQEIRVTALDDGFEWEGRVYRSLTSVARAVTGSKWNGRLFFGLTKRKR